MTVVWHWHAPAVKRHALWPSDNKDLMVTDLLELEASWKRGG